MNIEILKPLIEDGYKDHCDEIRELVMRRINYDGVILLEDYIANERGYVESGCVAKSS